jgi:predicted dehydrogenase
MAKWRIGVIGAGARGESFARQLHKGSRRAELFGVCDLDADRLAKFCDYCQLEGTRRYTDPAAFFHEKDLDAVIVTVPEFAHREVAVAAMRAGKHVYIEKPLAHTLADCRAIVEAHRQSRVVAYVGFNMRASPASQMFHDVARSGRLGTILHISGLEQLQKEHGAAFMRRFHRHSRNSGGLLNHKCCHDLDVMLWSIGHEHKIVRIASFGGTRVFTPDRQPAKYCHECPPKIYESCPYYAKAGYVFPVGGPMPIYHQDPTRYGGHGGTDPAMIGRFIDAIESGRTDSGLTEGLAPSVVAIKADEARLSGKVVEIPLSEYM